MRLVEQVLGIQPRVPDEDCVADMLQRRIGHDLGCDNSRLSAPGPLPLS